MYRKIVVTSMLFIVVMTSISNGAPPVNAGGAQIELVETPYLAQDEQYNVSSYYDFALATADVIASNLVWEIDGSVFRFGAPDWSTYGWAPNVADFFWAISAMARVYEITGNTTLSILISRVANQMVYAFQDPDYPGYYVMSLHNDAVEQSKRPGVQAYAYSALTIAEGVNASLDFTLEKQNAIHCLTDVLYDQVYGGLRFLTIRNCSTDDAGEALEAYPNDGKRLDHLALGAIALLEEGVLTGNSTLIDMGVDSLDFMITHMPVYNSSVYRGLRLATNRTGGDPTVPPLERPARNIVTDINGIAIRALLKGFEVTGNATFLNWAENTHNALIENHWDDENGGWFTETLDDNPWAPDTYEDTEEYKYAEIQFQMVYAQEHLYEVTGKFAYVQIIIDTLDIILAKMWDKDHGGFFANGNEESAVLTDDWKNHYTGVQAQAVLALERVWAYGLPLVSYVRVSPTNPRPTDYITFLATALDSDGIDKVVVNMTLELDGQVNHSQFVLESSQEFSGVFNSTYGTLPNGTRVNFLVIANDTLGNAFIAGNYYFIVRADVWAPVVLFRTVYPSTEPRVGDQIIIEFGTYEFPTHSMLTTFKMYWKVNDGYYEGYNMTWVDVDDQYFVWRIDLGSDFHVGDVISYYCIAVDESNNTGQSAFYRLTILGTPIIGNLLLTWQTIATIGLVAAPGVGYGITRIRRERALSTQREMKKEARKRSTKKKPRQQRSTRGN
ncbi:MAG: hypothetical protein ACXADC_12340 [Candidatus Thorarchaeota archaeon]|jgi:hypothetical protein